jgi:hypothetical protein
VGLSGLETGAVGRGFSSDFGVNPGVCVDMDSDTPGAYIRRSWEIKAFLKLRRLER